MQTRTLAETGPLVAGAERVRLEPLRGHLTRLGAFALSVDAGNEALRRRLDDTAAGRRPCAPSTLDDERQTNPFLRAPVLAASLGMDGAPDAEVFARLRKMKDEFRG